MNDMIFDSALQCDIERRRSTRPILVLIKVRALGLLHSGTCFFGTSDGKCDSARVTERATRHLLIHLTLFGLYSFPNNEYAPFCLMIKCAEIWTPQPDFSFWWVTSCRHLFLTRSSEKHISCIFCIVVLSPLTDWAAVHKQFILSWLDMINNVFLFVISIFILW